MVSKYSPKRVLVSAGKFLLGFGIVLSFLAFFSSLWYRAVYGDLNFDAILYTLTANTTNTNPDLVFSWISWTVPATLVLSAATIFFLVQTHWSVKIRIPKIFQLQLPLKRRWLSVSISLVLCVALLFSGVKISKADAYIRNLRTLSTVYEEQYKDPKHTTVTFPEEKRNLIYIYLESMEASYFSQEQGGMLPYNIIPELYSLARENTSFSHNTDIGGFTWTPGATWTIGAMVAQTAGIPLKTPPDIGGNDYGADGDFLPGVTTLTDILHENGYQQALMVGSDASFGGRKEYFTSHGVDRIYDLYTAQQDGLIPEDYMVWWGFEDLYLFTYAQQVITEMSQQAQPFAFTMLTVDTHHVDGYLCAYCEEVHEEQYENVMECSSRQVAAFVQWIQEQPFYENTTVVLVGDHPSMDNGYFTRNAPDDYDRHVYNCFLNPAAEATNIQNRVFCAYDLFPTTLAAMGCTIQGDRLGFGTDLFSATATLYEETDGAIADEFDKNSAYYTKYFFYK